MIGVNGTGRPPPPRDSPQAEEDGYSVVMAAVDTFRAGAIDQLASHAETGSQVHNQPERGRLVL